MHDTNVLARKKSRGYHHELTPITSLSLDKGYVAQLTLNLGYAQSKLLVIGYDINHQQYRRRMAYVSLIYQHQIHYRYGNGI